MWGERTFQFQPHFVASLDTPQRQPLARMPILDRQLANTAVGHQTLRFRRAVQPSLPGHPIRRVIISPGQWVDLRTENHSFQDISISQGRSGTLLGRDQPERVEALATSSNLFTLLGAQPVYGRLLTPDEDRPGRAPVIILSYACWTRLFNSDPRVIGSVVTINGIASRTSITSRLSACCGATSS